jgi:hypothetical protein
LPAEFAIFNAVVTMNNAHDVLLEITMMGGDTSHYYRDTDNGGDQPHHYISATFE